MAYDSFSLAEAQQRYFSYLAHQNRTIVIASEFRIDGAKLPEILQKQEVLGSEIAARNRKSLASDFPSHP